MKRDHGRSQFVGRSTRPAPPGERTAPAERQQLLEEQHRNTARLKACSISCSACCVVCSGGLREDRPKQMLLFNDLLEQLAPETPAPQPARSQFPNRPRHPSRERHGRRRSSSDWSVSSCSTICGGRKALPLLREDAACDRAGDQRAIRLRSGRVKVIEHVRLKYACPQCEKNASEGGPHITVAERPLPRSRRAWPLRGCSVTDREQVFRPSAAARLEKILDRHRHPDRPLDNVRLDGQCAEVLDPLYRRMIEQVLGSEVIHTDDTPVDVQDRSLDRTARADSGITWATIIIPAPSSSTRRADRATGRWSFCETGARIIRFTCRPMRSAGMTASTWQGRRASQGGGLLGARAPVLL